MAIKPYHIELIMYYLYLLLFQMNEYFTFNIVELCWNFTQAIVIVLINYGFITNSASSGNVRIFRLNVTLFSIKFFFFKKPYLMCVNIN